MIHSIVLLLAFGFFAQAQNPSCEDPLAQALVPEIKFVDSLVSSLLGREDGSEKVKTVTAQFTKIVDDELDRHRSSEPIDFDESVVSQRFDELLLVAKVNRGTRRFETMQMLFDQIRDQIERNRTRDRRLQKKDDEEAILHGWENPLSKAGRGDLLGKLSRLGFLAIDVGQIKAGEQILEFCISEINTTRHPVRLLPMASQFILDLTSRNREDLVQKSIRGISRSINAARTTMILGILRRMQWDMEFTSEHKVTVAKFLGESQRPFLTGADALVLLKQMFERGEAKSKKGELDWHEIVKDIEEYEQEFFVQGAVAIVPTALNFTHASRALTWSTSFNRSTLTEGARSLARTALAMGDRAPIVDVAHFIKAGSSEKYDSERGLAHFYQTVVGKTIPYDLDLERPERFRAMAYEAFLGDDILFPVVSRILEKTEPSLALLKFYPTVAQRLVKSEGPTYDVPAFVGAWFKAVETVAHSTKEFRMGFEALDTEYLRGQSKAAGFLSRPFPESIHHMNIFNRHLGHMAAMQVRTDVPRYRTLGTMAFDAIDGERRGAFNIFDFRLREGNSGKIRLAHRYDGVSTKLWAFADILAKSNLSAEDRGHLLDSAVHFINESEFDVAMNFSEMDERITPAALVVRDLYRHGKSKQAQALHDKLLAQIERMDQRWDIAFAAEGEQDTYELAERRETVQRWREDLALSLRVGALEHALPLRFNGNFTALDELQAYVRSRPSMTALANERLLEAAVLLTKYRDLNEQTTELFDEIVASLKTVSDSGKLTDHKAGEIFAALVKAELPGPLRDEFVARLVRAAWTGKAYLTETSKNRNKGELVRIAHVIIPTHDFPKAKGALVPLLFESLAEVKSGKGYSSVRQYRWLRPLVELLHANASKL